MATMPSSFEGVPFTVQPALVVDLDGTLIHTDMLHESALQLLREHPLQTLQIPGWLRRGKATLKERLTERTLGLEELLALAAPLGADVPFVVRAAFPLGGLAVGEGTGTELSIVELPEDMIPLDIVLVAASEGLSTPQVFSELDEGRAAGRYPEAGELQVPSGLLHALTQTETPIARIHEIGRQLRNDLQGPAVTLAPSLETILTMDNESIVEAFVSGSGPTVAILVEDAPAADELAAALRRRGRHAVASQTPAML